MLLRKNIVAILFVILPAISMAVLPHKDASVLATGKWYKLAVTEKGIHRITYNDLISLGISPGEMETAKIRLYGNGSGMLSEINSIPRYDDLREIAIEVHDGGDGRFDADDYILFYGEGADKWNYEQFFRLFSHVRNLYSDSTYYFLNFDRGAGRRVQTIQPLPDPTNNVSVRFDDYQLHELDLENVLRSGKEWYGEFFDNSRNSWDFPFLFPNADSLATARVRTSVMGFAPVTSIFRISQNGNLLDSLSVDSTNPAEFTVAGASRFKQTTIPNPGSDQTITVTYKLPDKNSHGWLNYLEVNCPRLLKWTGHQMAFRDINSIGTGKVTEFNLGNANNSVRVWDVTNPVTTRELTGTLDGGMLKFKQYTDSLREFIAFDGSVYYPVTCIGEVANQDLHHDSAPANLVIVTHPLFLAQAERLASFHREHNGLTVRVVTTAQVYNEFACGQPDPTAIRDYMKMLYDRADSAARPRYLLLFGDGSYDPKNRVAGNNNMIPTFQSLESLNSTKSYVSDDFFGIMGDNSGSDANGKIDIGIGRLPVSDTTEARVMVDKIMHYSSVESPVRGDWRNNITFIADDENNNIHLNQAEELANIVAYKYPLFNVNKIYFDAFKLVEIPSGSRFPDANIAINDAVAKGSLIVNYTGHGGETGWSVEQCLTMADISSWSNADKLPVFVTATCEFSRFDNPQRFTAGEKVILHPSGGAIALYSTTRLAFAGLNIMLDTSFFRHLMDRNTDGQYLKMGDLIRISKNNNSNNFQLRNFVLLGDPAQSIGFSNYNVKTLSVNDEALNQPDTVKGMSQVTVKGRIEDDYGQKIDGFDGTVSCRVFDKPVIFTTLGNRPGSDGSYPENFKMQNSVLFKGDVSVKSGEFRFSFVVPKGIPLSFGKGKLSYYAWNSETDAAGYNNQVVVGGKDTEVPPDNNGPEIGLWMNDRYFISGGTTGASPVLLADLYDTNGINSYGLGIGHEIEMVLDNDRPHAVILNDYYAPLFGCYTRGTITYPFSDLSSGNHTLKLRAWDLFDNSAEKEIAFYVPENRTLTVRQVMNVPNPMTDKTEFRFRPDQVDFSGVDVKIRVYNIQGKMVAQLSSGISGISSSGVGAISWDGTDMDGNRLRPGIYPYKICFAGKNGGYSETYQKLIIAR